jgi:hypothetical protein
MNSENILQNVRVRSPSVLWGNSMSVKVEMRSRVNRMESNIKQNRVDAIKTTLFGTALHNTTRYSTALHYSALHCTISYSCTLQHTADEK